MTFSTDVKKDFETALEYIKKMDKAAQTQNTTEYQRLTQVLEKESPKVKELYEKIRAAKEDKSSALENIEQYKSGFTDIVDLLILQHLLKEGLFSDDERGDVDLEQVEGDVFQFGGGTGGGGGAGGSFASSQEEEFLERDEAYGRDEKEDDASEEEEDHDNHSGGGLDDDNDDWSLGDDFKANGFHRQRPFPQFGGKCAKRLKL